MKDEPVTQPPTPPPAPEAPVEPRSRDPHRPIYHFLPLNNWMNDPNGLIKWNGQYHLFFQYNPNGPFHGTIHWGHAVSADLVHWTYLPIALSPTPGTADEDGCWSGCAVDADGTPTLIYTGLRGLAQSPCLATSAGDLLTWRKHPANPVIASPPPGLDVTGFRDHWVWREGGMWYQIIGSGIAGVGGAALLYSSPDLVAWEYLHPLCVGDLRQTEPLYTGTMWECPQLLFFGERAVLIVSVHDHQPLYTAALVGTYRDQRFELRTVHKLDFGDVHFYAPQILIDDDGRKLMWGWIHEGRHQEAWQTAGWAGVMSLPRVVTLGNLDVGRGDDGLLCCEPAPELAALRGAHTRIAACELSDDAGDPLEGIEGDAVEISAVFEHDGHAVVGLVLRRSPDGEEQTIIGYDPQEQHLFIDRRGSSNDPQAQHDVQRGPLALPPGEPLTLRLFLDRSVVEVFANGRACLTSRVYPTRPDSLGIRTFRQGGPARLRSFELWQMRAARLAAPATEG